LTVFEMAEEPRAASKSSDNGGSLDAVLWKRCGALETIGA
jgi:hypothetical protein